MVSRAQGALGLLPFAVRPGCPEVAESRGARDSGPNFSAGPWKGNTPDRVDRTMGCDQNLNGTTMQSNTFESTTQRR